MFTSWNAENIIILHAQSVNGCCQTKVTNIEALVAPDLRVKLFNIEAHLQHTQDILVVWFGLRAPVPPAQESLRALPLITVNSTQSLVLL